MKPSKTAIWCIDCNHFLKCKGVRGYDCWYEHCDFYEEADRLRKYINIQKLDVYQRPLV
jgi:hypothetical protein